MPKQRLQRSLPWIAPPSQHSRAAGYNSLVPPCQALPRSSAMPSSSRSAKPRPAQVLTVGNTEVRFEWRGDRWTHAVRFEGSPDLLTTGPWQSVEGPGDNSRDDRWPPSPVFVELHTHPAAGSVAVMGLGLAGRSHFSASIGPDNQVPGALRFDIAARIHEPPVQLGSTYRSGGPTAVILRVEPLPLADAPLPRTVEWSYRISPHGIEPLPGSRLSSAGSASA